MSQFLYVLDPFFVRTKRDVDLPMVVASVSHVDPEAGSESYSYSNVQTSEAEGLKIGILIGKMMIKHWIWWCHMTKAGEFQQATIGIVTIAISIRKIYDHYEHELGY
jgi:hypothetical protein